MIIATGTGGECVGFFIVMLIWAGSVASYSQALSGHGNLVKVDLFRHAWMHMRHSPTREHTLPRGARTECKVHTCDQKCLHIYRTKLNQLEFIILHWKHMKLDLNIHCIRYSSFKDSGFYQYFYYTDSSNI